MARRRNGSGTPIACRLIIDTGVRFTVALFHPFSERHALRQSAGLDDVIVGVGAGGYSRGDVGRLDLLSLGPVSFANPVAVFSRDTSGVFGQDGPDGIVGDSARQAAPEGTARDPALGLTAATEAPFAAAAQDPLPVRARGRLG